MKIQPNSAAEKQPVLPDMSGEAILNRLEMVGALNDLCRFLGNSELSSTARGQTAARKLPEASVVAESGPSNL